VLSLLPMSTSFIRFVIRGCSVTCTLFRFMMDGEGLQDMQNKREKCVCSAVHSVSG